jgi:hypothetical protein
LTHKYKREEEKKRRREKEKKRRREKEKKSSVTPRMTSCKGIVPKKYFFRTMPTVETNYFEVKVFFTTRVFNSTPEYS